jgi:hypothetical protein
MTMSAEPDRQPDAAAEDESTADPSDSPFDDPPLQEIERGLTDWRGKESRAGRSEGTG